MQYKLYQFFRPLATCLIRLLYRVEYINIENIPQNGPFILAGNHKSNFDCVLLISSCSKTINFLAKRELIDGKLGFFFKRMGIIPVDRKHHNKEATNKAISILNDGGIIGIFPEGTFNKTPYVVRPFKYGTVKMAYKANVKIVPFAIVGDYKLFRRSVKIVFDKPYEVKTNDIKGENITLMNNVISLLKNEYN